MRPGRAQRTAWRGRRDAAATTRARERGWRGRGRWPRAAPKQASAGRGPSHKPTNRGASRTAPVPGGPMRGPPAPAEQQHRFSAKPERPGDRFRLPARLVDGAAGLGPILEGAEIVDLLVAEVLEHLAGQGRAPAGGAIHDDTFVLREILVVVRRLRIGAKFQHAARDVHRAGNLAAL